jgi:hypothetical protein
MFEREDWTLFRTLSTLGQKAGVPVEQIPAVVAKELVDNALDEAGDCRIGLLEGNGIWIEDDGDGIPGDDEAVARTFSIRRPLTSSKLLRRPSRGALGNGLRIVAGAVLATGGALEVSTRARTLRLVPQFDTGETAAAVVGNWPRAGTRVEVRFGTSLTCDDPALEWALDAVLLAGGGSSYKGKTSPHWYDRDAFFELLQAAGRRTVREVVGEFDGCSGKKAGRLAADFKGRLAVNLDRAEADRLHQELKASAKLVNAERLGFVGPIHGLPPSYARIPASFSLASSGKLKTLLPVMVEAWAEIISHPNKVGIHVFVNRTPITAPISAWHDKKGLCLSGCGLEHRIASCKKASVLLVNVTTPYMPLTSDGKAPNLRPLLGPIIEAAQKAIVRASRLVSSSVVAPNGSRLTQKDVILAHINEAVAKASGDGQYRFSIRQLYYAIRPFAIASLGVELKYSNFTGVIRDYEADEGDLLGMYRDNRGVLYHPHDSTEVPLGTLNVEAYRRPEWTFNKILYCEKEGFFPILRDAKWPERHDCALLTSKGFASRAARDVIDLLGDTDEDLWFYCIHDADAYGTMIYQALQEATRARPARRVHIVNLGLEPAEALEMGLQVEAVEREGNKAAPVASYVDPEWAKWLQSNRVELNAMTTPQFLAWLDRKFADQVGKLIPPADVLQDRLEQGVREELNRRITRRILHRARLEQRVERAFRSRLPVIGERSETLPVAVAEALRERPAESWTDPIGRVAKVIAKQSVSQEGGPKS